MSEQDTSICQFHVFFPRGFLGTSQGKLNLYTVYYINLSTNYLIDLVMSGTLLYNGSHLWSLHTVNNEITVL